MLGKYNQRSNGAHMGNNLTQNSVPNTPNQVTATRVKANSPPRGWVWECGITTVPSRIHDGTLAKTLASLDRAGFKPRIFIDGVVSPIVQSELMRNYAVSFRNEPLQVAGNWWLSIWELYLRNPYAHIYAMFQDDITLCYNLREYIESCENLPTDDFYFNLFTDEVNTKRLPNNFQGWIPAQAKGRGALALVFTIKVLQKLLCSQHMVDRFTDSHTGSYKLPRRMRSVDGGIWNSLHKANVKELVHLPSLVQHKGVISTVESSHNNQPAAPTYVGEDFDMRLFKPTAYIV